jgi:hypothetical protein
MSASTFRSKASSIVLVGMAYDLMVFGGARISSADATDASVSWWPSRPRDASPPLPLLRKCRCEMDSARTSGKSGCEHCRFAEAGRLDTLVSAALAPSGGGVPAASGHAKGAAAKGEGVSCEREVGQRNCWKGRRK